MSRDFDGATGVIGLPITSILRPNAPITVAAWVRPDTLVVGGGIFTTNKTDATHRGMWMSCSDASGHLEVSFGDNTGTASTDRRSKVTTATLATGTWNHVAVCVRAATDMDAYINAVEGGSYSGTGGNMAYNTGVAGRIGMQGGVLFDGRIAEVGIWTVTLSAAEVLALSKGVSPRRIRPDSLIGYWPLYGVASPEPDLSGSVQNGTVTAATLADHAPVGSYAG